jgi:hypothetical protein
MTAAGQAHRVFINYRRQDTAFPAAWLYQQLIEHFGQSYVFKDVDSIRPGENFAKVVVGALESCHTVLVVIGQRWLSIADGGAYRRIDMPNDLVRIEIETALRHDVAIIPVLIEGARMPRSDELPDSIAALADYNAIEISPTYFESSVRRLIESIKTNEVEAEARAAQQRAVAQSQRNSRVTRTSLMSATGKKSPRIRILSIRWNIAAHSAIRKPLPDESVNDNDNYKQVLASYTLLDSAWTNAVLRFGKANPLILTTTIKHQGKRLAKVTFDDDWMTIAANTADLRAFVRKLNRGSRERILRVLLELFRMTKLQLGSDNCLSKLSGK